MTSTVRPLRQDAARNRERLVAAAREVFRRRGLDAPMDEIARAAGVAIGTLYNRFASRGELVDAALGPLARQAVELAERAARIDDPWRAFAAFMEDTCALFATDRGYADMYRSRRTDTPVITAAQQRLGSIKTALLTAAKDAGVLRADVEPVDLALLSWGLIGAMDATRDAAPDAWRRHLALMLDGLRPEGAHPLPVPALTRDQMRRAVPGAVARAARS
jgi:AcrR family transcriptional regulator